MSRIHPSLRVAVLALVVCLLVPAAASAQSFGSRALHRGLTGSDVRTLQHDLTEISLPTPASGYFGTKTQRNVRRFQLKRSLRANGVLTRPQAKLLRKLVARKSVTSSTASASSGGATVEGAAPPTGRARLNPDGTATAPADAPDEVKDVIAAGNRIAFKPYHYGGGHGRWNDSGYDCSGSVSYALHGGGLLNTQLDSTSLESYGRRGKGSWITIYANGGHTFMYVAGLRFDTSGLSADGSRWHTSNRPKSGYVVRHPAGF